MKSMRHPFAVLLAALAGLAAHAPAPPASALTPGELMPPGPHRADVPTPASLLGFEVGERHVRHDRLVAYVETLAAASDRVLYAVQGRTHEGRVQPLLTVSSPANLARLDAILAAHRAATEPPYDAEPDEAPAIVWLGYSIHGDEASGSNAALLVAYHLAASESEEVAALLSEVVVLIDPSLNPDGLDRFATWANMHHGRVAVGDRNHREHRQAWPGGRTNHYWFDLNRDWLPAQHPETRARLATLRRWRPHLLADFHEMGTDATYFFQPGVPSRQNPLTPAENLELTRRIARHHAAAFDAAGRLYYSEETFDDFYYGKGSTYPDVQGAIGILFEQASARGHLADTDNGPLSFADAVQGHLMTSFSTLEAARVMRRDLLAYHAGFFRRATEEAAQGALAAYLVGDGGDPARAWHFLDLLAAHGIEVRALAQPVEADGVRFRPGHAWLVPAAQRQAKLVQALFERRTEFADAAFYDVSAWTAQLAFGLPFAELGRGAYAGRMAGAAFAAGERPPAGRMPAAGGETGGGAGPAYAWLFAWNGYYAPRALHRLLAAGVAARVATAPFETETRSGRRSFAAGTVVVPRGLQSVEPADVEALLATAAAEDGLEVYAVDSGLTASGADLGSPGLRPLEPPRVLLAVGSGVSPSEAGEAWHLLDRRYRMPVSLVERDRLGRVDLAVYTHVVLVDGRWGDLGRPAVAALRRWLRGGGVVVATQDAADWSVEALAGDESEGGEAAARRSDGGERQPEAPSPPEPGPAERAAYGDYADDVAERLVAGAIFEVELDLTHPLAYGFDDRRLALFRDGSEPMAAGANPYENVAVFSQRPLLAGYAAADNVGKLAGTAAVVASRVGEGTLVRFADDPAFRAYFFGSDRLLANAIFFGKAIRRTDPVGD